MTVTGQFFPIELLQEWHIRKPIPGRRRPVEQKQSSLQAIQKKGLRIWF
jgi:hypothetical protein